MKWKFFLGLLVWASLFSGFGANASVCNSSLDCPGQFDNRDEIFCCVNECCSQPNLTEEEMYAAQAIGFLIIGLVLFGVCCFCGTCCYCIFRKKKRRGTVLQPPANQGNDTSTGGGYVQAPTYPPNYPPGGAYPPATAYPPAPSYNVGPTYPPAYPPETKDGAPLYPPATTGGAAPYTPAMASGAPTYPPATTTYPPATTTYPPGVPSYPPQAGYPPGSTSAAPYPPNQPPPTYSEYTPQPAFNPNLESKKD